MGNLCCPSLVGSHPPPWVFPSFHPSWNNAGPLPSSRYLGGEHVGQAVGGSVEREAPDQVDEEHAVRQRRGEVHHLRAPGGAPEGRVSLGDAGPRAPLVPGTDPWSPWSTRHRPGRSGYDGWKGMATGSEFGLGELGCWHAFPRLRNHQATCFLDQRKLGRGLYLPPSLHPGSTAERIWGYLGHC